MCFISVSKITIFNRDFKYLFITVIINFKCLILPSLVLQELSKGIEITDEVLSSHGDLLVSRVFYILFELEITSFASYSPCMRCLDLLIWILLIGNQSYDLFCVCTNEIYRKNYELTHGKNSTWDTICW